MNPFEESAFWDDVAGTSDRIEANVYSGLNLDDCLGAITSQIEMVGWILELGCGPGRLTRALAAAYPDARFIGVDSSKLMIELAVLLAPEIVWSWNNGRDLALIHDNFADAAYSMTTFQHIPHEAQQGYLAELHRVVKPGGKLRLQFVTEGEPGPLSHPTTVKEMLGFADAAGWRETKVDVGLIHAEWVWVTLTNL